MKRMLLILILLSLFAGVINAISLDECVALARKNNKVLLAAREDIVMADQTYYEVRGMLLPQLSLQGGYQLNTTWLPKSSIPSAFDFSESLDENASPNDSILADILTGFTNSMIPDKVMKEGSVAAQIKLEQILFSGGKLINGINAVNRYRSIQKLKYKLLEQDVVVKTTDMYFQTVLAGKVVDIQQEGLDTANLHLDRVILLNREGQVSEFDLLRARLEVAKINPELIKAKNMYDLALTAFKKQIGYTDEYLILDQELTNLPPIEQIELDSALALAEKQRLELELASIGTEISHIRYKAEKGNYLPVVGLTAGYSLFTAANKYIIESNDFGTSLSAGIGFSIPIFTGLSNSAKRSYAKHAYKQTQILEDDAREWVALEVKQTWQNLQNALESYNVQRENIRLAERSLQLAQVRYDNQVGIQLEVFDAQMMLNSIRLSYYNSVYDVISANQKFKKAMGYIL
jgi:outer membrane protein